VGEMAEYFPGQVEAKHLGYSLYATSGDKNSAIYNKNCLPWGILSLRVTSKGEATLSSSYKMVRLEVGPFSFPHKNFVLFEQQLLRCMPEQ
jgi:hypothetical protein